MTETLDPLDHYPEMTMTDPKAAPSTITKHSRETLFTVVATPGEYYVEYVLYEISGFQYGDQPLWASDTVGYVDTLEQAQPYLHGSVKWDGCSNWYFDEQERAMLHACTRKELLNLSAAMALCWDWTAELCPNWAPC